MQLPYSEMNRNSGNNTDFKKYKEIKSKLDVRYNGYNLQNIIAHDIAKLVYKNKIPKIKSVFRWFVIPSPNFFKRFFNYKYMVSNIYPQRKDYCLLFNMIKKELAVTNKTLVYNYGLNIGIVLSVRNIVNSINEARKAKCLLSFRETMYFAASLTYYKNILDSFEKKLTKRTKVKHFFASNSSSTPDSILCLYFNKLGINTYSLQHGAYTLFQRYTPLDVINTENMTAQKMLCWGQSTVDLMLNLGYEKEALIIVGNPRYKNIELVDVKKSFKSGIVFLGRYIYNEENMKLLEVLGELIKKDNNIAISVKLHPSLNENRYDEVIKSLKLKLISKDNILTELIDSEEFDFAVSYNSTAYFEPLTNGIPCFRFSLNENEDLFGMDDKFGSVQELILKIAKFKKMNGDKLLAEMNRVLQYAFNIEDVNYRKIISD